MFHVKHRRLTDMNHLRRIVSQLRVLMLVTRVLDENRRWLRRKARHIAVTGGDTDTEWSFLPAENAMFHEKRSGMRKGLAPVPQADAAFQHGGPQF